MQEKIQICQLVYFKLLILRWTNHLNSKKHKTGEKKLKGDKLREYQESLNEIDLFIAQYNTSEPSDEDDQGFDEE